LTEKNVVAAGGSVEKARRKCQVLDLSAYWLRASLRLGITGGASGTRAVVARRRRIDSFTPKVFVWV